MQKLVAEIMAAWRRAERLAASLPEGSPEHDAADGLLGSWGLGGRLGRRLRPALLLFGQLILL